MVDGDKGGCRDRWEEHNLRSHPTATTAGPIIVMSTGAMARVIARSCMFEMMGGSAGGGM